MGFLNFAEALPVANHIGIILGRKKREETAHCHYGWPRDFERSQSPIHVSPPDAGKEVYKSLAWDMLSDVFSGRG
jgi:hypothetical protein